MTRTLVALAALAALGCQGPLTEIVLVVTADVADLEQVRIRVDGPSGMTAIDQTMPVAGGTLPFTLSLTRSGPPYEPLVIVVTGTSTSAGEIVRRVETGFVANERRILTIVLERACAATTCAATQTCIAGSCTSPAIEPQTLPLFAGEIPAIDAAAPDAGPPDGGPPDTGVDGGQDAGPDPCAGTCATGELCVYARCFAAPWASVAIGEAHLCTVESAPGPVRCFGANESGQLGDGTTTDPTTFVEAIGITDAVAVTAGRAHTCARTMTGQVFCWGANDQLQLGIAGMASVPMPTEVVGAGGNVTMIAAGADHTCIVRDAEVHCWGANADGQLGDGTMTSRSTVGPTIVSTAVEVAPGGGFTCALRADGTARCWGDNASGQLGDGTMVDQLSPVAVTLPPPTVLAHVVAGVSHACGLSTSSNVLCWGAGMLGQLGDGTTLDRGLAATTTDFGLAESVAAGSDHAISRRPDARLFGWGDNSAMQLAPVTAASSAAPVELRTGLRVDRIWAGRATSCWWERDVGPHCTGRAALPPSP